MKTLRNSKYSATFDDTVYHGFDAEAELSKLLSQMINEDIGRSLREYVENHLTNEEKICSDIDPYNEENWEYEEKENWWLKNEKRD
jgi:hypothetical protein